MVSRETDVTGVRLIRRERLNSVLLTVLANNPRRSRRVIVPVGRVEPFLALLSSMATKAELESLGYGAIWVGGSPPGDLELAGKLLAATRRIAVATGIVNIWKDDPETVAASYHRLAAAHPGRFLLGVGVCIQVLGDDPRAGYRALAGVLPTR